MKWAENINFNITEAVCEERGKRNWQTVVSGSASTTTDLITYFLLQRNKSFTNKLVSSTSSLLLL
jgi:hypothetical protein